MTSLPQYVKFIHMDNLLIKAILAGIFMGLWPLFMNKTGLNGNVAVVIFSALVAIVVIPFAVVDFGNMANVRWWVLAITVILGAAGMIFFNGMLAKATPQSVGTLFVLMIIVQTSIPAIYQVIQNGGISLMKGAGFLLAIIAAILLIKGK